ncbi:MAG: RIP metalloprotease RseP [Planctomycetes bacterium]|nr:RIP metalloprotease RseP [Planctomycetota bacterium]
MDLTLILNIFYAFIGIGIIIFIHELGHFLAAKKAGVRVERFSIGFDPPLFGRKLRLCACKWGGTEYVVGLIPFGGYVKMAGETVLDPESQKSPPQPDWLLSKPAGSRAIVFAAGGLFNILSAFFFFALAFSLGVKFPPPVIGEIEPGSPAWKSGLRIGDRIAAVEGEPISEFSEIFLAIALGKKEGAVTIEYERDGKPQPPLEVEPEWNPQAGVRAIGIVQPQSPEISKVDPKGAAAAAGVQKGDRLTGARLGAIVIKETAFSHLMDAINTYHELNPDQPFELFLERQGQALQKTIQTEKTGKKQKFPRLGVLPIDRTGLVQEIQPGSTALAYLKPEDRILTVGGRPFLSLQWNILQALFPVERTTLALEVEGKDGAIRKVEMPREELLLWSIRREVFSPLLLARLGALAEGSPWHQAGFRSGDLIIKIGHKWITSRQEIAEILGDFPADRLEVQVVRGDRRLPEPLDVSRQLLLEPGKAAWDEAPAAIAIPGSPAGRIGIEDGSKILRINGKAIGKWDDLMAAVRTAGEKKAEIEWQPPGGEKKIARTSLLGDEYQPLGWEHEPARIITKAGVLDSAVLGLKRTGIVAQQVLVTLKALFQAKVHTKNLAGPVGIVHIIVNVSEYGLGTLIYFLALISVNLGIFNLLPFPILDGGHLFFLLIEKIKGSPVDIRVQEIATTVAFFLIIGLAIYLTYNDLSRLFGFR